MEDAADQLPGWVYWWVPPARRPFLSIVLLVFVIALGWVPVVFEWGIISDPLWGAGS